MLLRLPTRFRAPVLVQTLEVGNATTLIALQNKFLELRNSHLQHCCDSPKTCIERLLGCAGQLLKKIPAKWIPNLAYRSIGLSHQLRHEVKVADLRQGLSD